VVAVRWLPKRFVQVTLFLPTSHVKTVTPVAVEAGTLRLHTSMRHGASFLARRAGRGAR
jgi:hypothetical protein